MRKILESLHPLERKILPLLKESSKFDDLIKISKLKEVEVMRALQWMQNKKILKVKQELKEIIKLDKNGEKYKNSKLPERIFLESLNDNSTIEEIKRKRNLNKEEFSIAFGLLKKKNLIEIKDGKLKRTKQGHDYLNKEFLEEKFLKKLPLDKDKLNDEEKYAFNELIKRREIIKVDLVKNRIIKLNDLGKELVKEKIDEDLIENLDSNLLKNGKWKNRKFRRYDIKNEVPKINLGKRHFVNQAIEYARNVWIEMGFKEMKGPIVESSFWVFDALFTVQDHPIREMQDTFFIKNPEYAKLPKNLIKNVRRAHEDGFGTGSKGWQYNWKEEEARKNILRTHTTSLSARTLANLKKKDLPAKFFSVGRCFRNETVDWSHLFEFNQTEGIVVDPNANFKHLLGYLKRFFSKMGFPKARFRPAFFAYTEPSVEIDVFHPVHKKWIELGGAGMFRPEVTKALLGFECPVLAWGPGLDRIMMDYYKIQDMREIYKNDLKQLREMKIWLK